MVYIKVISLIGVTSICGGLLNYYSMVGIPKNEKIVIVGGGTMGLSSAYQLAKKDKNEISKINRLSGAHRWDVRWFKELELEEFYVSYTKDGQLTYFEHMVSDSLAGDSLSQDIAYDIAKIFLKNMPSNEFPCISDYVENDWKIILHDTW